MQIQNRIKVRARQIVLACWFVAMMAVLLVRGQPTARALFPDSPAPITTSPEEISWQIECVDCPKQFVNTGNRRLALDSLGRPHIAYGGDHLYYSWYDGTSWHTETVDNATRVGAFAALALDGLGRPHIGYYDETRRLIKYATKNGDAWRISIADDFAYVADSISIALDAANRPHISYLNHNRNLFYYIYWNETAWNVLEIPGSSSIKGYAPSLAVDGAGHPHLMYTEPEFIVPQLRYAYWNGNAWEIQVIGDGMQPSLKLDNAGRPHVSYTLAWSDGLKYAYWDGMAWQIQTINNTGLLSSLILDSEGHPHISYATDAGIGYTHWSGVDWETQTIGETGYPSLALDGNDQPHISYVDAPERNLKYTFREQGVWKTQVVDYSRKVTAYTSLALDHTGRPSISYCDQEGLKYTRRRNDAWETQIVGASAWGPSLVIDRNDHPHISYFDWATRDLRYAHWTGSYWDVQTVDHSGIHYTFTSLALDNNDFPHIAYSTSAGHRYARLTDTTWEMQTFDPDESNSYSVNALALDTTGRPHIGYYAPRQGPMYAYWNGQAWEVQNIQNVAPICTMVLDSADRPHVSGYSWGYDDRRGLMYAHLNGAVWETQRVELYWTPSDYPPSLALAANDRPHISYYADRDVRSRYLRYAHWDGSVWLVSTVDETGGNVGAYASLALDSAGRTHISYLDANSYDLKYAVGLPLASRAYLPIITR
jgi:hypothetical protein